VSYQQPKPGIYYRKNDNAEVHVEGVTGSEWNDTVLCRSYTPTRRTWHVRLENFWKKYKETAR
jgi:hypothetical protein